MRRHARTLRLCTAATALAGLAACDHDHDDGDHDHDRAVELRFAAVVGAEPFACTKTFTVGAVELEPLDFRLYVHGVQLVDADGGKWPVTLSDDGLWQDGAVALLDFEDKSGTCVNGTTEVNDVVKGTVDTGHDAIEFVGVELEVGVPFDENHQDVAAAASPLNLSGLFWSWQGGYKFMRLDMKMAGTEGGSAHGDGINVHLGSTGCTLAEGTTEVGSCTAPNRPHVALDGFDPADDTIVIDYAAVVAGLDLMADAGGAPGCMSGADDPECATIFDHLGLDLATGLPKAGQTVFSVESAQGGQ